MDKLFPTYFRNETEVQKTGLSKPCGGGGGGLLRRTAEARAGELPDRSGPWREGWPASPDRGRGIPESRRGPAPVRDAQESRHGSAAPESADVFRTPCDQGRFSAQL